MIVCAVSELALTEVRSEFDEGRGQRLGGNGPEPVLPHPWRIDQKAALGQGIQPCGGGRVFAFACCSGQLASERV